MSATLEGIRVVDAKKPRTIEVKQLDITRRGVKEPGSCAVAQACRRAFNGADARVYLTRTFVKIGDKWTRFRTPQSIRSEIIAFDRGGTFEPGTYTLSPMPECLKIGQRTNTKTGPKRTKGKKKRAYHLTVNVRERAPLS